MSKRKEALALSINALLGGPAISPPVETKDTIPTTAASVSGSQSSASPVRKLPVSAIIPNPRQPRMQFDPSKLEELTNSVRNHGILQPLLVTRRPDGSHTLLAGERRLRAATAAGLKEVPVHIIDATEEQLLELSIVENVQRHDLNPIEEARAYKALISSFGWTQETISQRVGKSRPTVTNALRLLNLSEEAQASLERNEITAGHARALLSMDDPVSREKLRKEIIAGLLSVREAERRATELSIPSVPPQKGSPPKAGVKKSLPERKHDVDMVALQDRLVDRLGCPVRIRARRGQSGTIEVHYHTLDDLDRVLSILKLDDD